MVICHRNSCKAKHIEAPKGIFVSRSARTFLLASTALVAAINLTPFAALAEDLNTDQTTNTSQVHTGLNISTEAPGVGDTNSDGTITYTFDGDGGNATLSLSGETRIGYQSGPSPYDANGALHLTNQATATADSAIWAGLRGKGSLTVDQGSTLTITSGADMYIGYNDPGTVVVKDAGSSLTADRITFWNKHSKLSILDGGRVTADVVDLGQTDPWDATLTINGQGSSLIARVLYSSGILNILNGGSAEFSEDIKIRHSVLVDGAGSSLSIGADAVFMFRHPKMTVSNGGTVTVGGEIRLGTDGGDSGTLIVKSGGAVTVGSGTGIINVGGVGDPHMMMGEPSPGLLAIGAEEGAAEEAGTISAGQLKMAENGVLRFNHTSADYELNSNITGVEADPYGFPSWGEPPETIEAPAGKIEHWAGTTRLTGIVSSVAETEVTGGSLFLANGNSTLGDVTVSGGTFGGVGTIGSLMVNNGGRYAPGNSIGTQTASSVTFAEGSTYEVEVDKDGNSDRLNVTGGATIQGGSVVVRAENGTDDGSTYGSSTNYTILSADGGVNGSFDQVTENFAFLKAALSYTENDVILTLAADVGDEPGTSPDGDKPGTSPDGGKPGTSPSVPDFSAKAKGPNGKGSAEAIEKIGSGPLFDAVMGMADGETEQAFADLSGGVHASIYATGLKHAALPRNTVLNRIRLVDGGVGASNTPLLGYASTGETVALGTYGPAYDALTGETPKPYSVWTNVFGTWTDQRGDDGAPGVSANATGLMLGADMALGADWRAGVSAGIGRDWFESPEARSNGNNTNFYAGVYGGRSFGDIKLRTGASHTFSKVDTSRVVSFTGFNERLTADYWSGTTQGYVEAGWVQKFGAFELEPFAALALVHQRTDGFSETGGTAALTADSASLTQGESTVGLRVAHAFSLGGFDGTIGANAAWRHTYGALASDVSMRFSTGNSFSVTGTSADRDAALAGLNIDLDITETGTFKFSYDGEFGEHVTSQTVRGGLTFRF